MEWIKGPPKTIGLYVIEWVNMHGLAVFLVYNRKGKLRYMDCEKGCGGKTYPYKKFAISRHMALPMPEFDDPCPNTPNVYEVDRGNGFDLETGRYHSTPEECFKAYKELIEAFSGKKWTAEEEAKFRREREEEEERLDAEDAEFGIDYVKFS